jgi:hypothetical protein
MFLLGTPPEHHATFRYCNNPQLPVAQWHSPGDDMVQNQMDVKGSPFLNSLLIG